MYQYRHMTVYTTDLWPMFISHNRYYKQTTSSTSKYRQDRQVNLLGSFATLFITLFDTVIREEEREREKERFFLFFLI